MAQTIALKVRGIYNDIKEPFELITKEMQQKYKKYNYNYLKDNINRNNVKELYDAYERPSKEKARIFEKYKKLNDNWVDCYGIYSYNCMQFTLAGFVEINNKPYYILITKTHNYLIEA